MSIGIVTLSFNQGRFLREAIASIHQDSSVPVCHVVVDPGSTDGSREIIEECRNLFSHVILEPDMGPADGLSKGFRLLDAPILGYLNADDRFTPGALNFVRDFFDRNPEVDVLLGAIRIIDENGTPRFRIRRPDPFDLRRFAYQVCNVYQQGTFFRAAAFRRTSGFNPSSPVWWDAELVVDMALSGCRLANTRRILGDLRIYRESITGSRRLAHLHQPERERIRAKILAAGIPAMGPLEMTLQRVFYRFSIARHVSYLCYRAPLCNAVPSRVTL